MPTTEATAEVKAIFSVVDQASAPIQKIAENLRGVATAAKSVATDVPRSLAEVAQRSGVAWRPGDVVAPVTPAVTAQVTKAADAISPAIGEQINLAATAIDKVSGHWTKLRDDIAKVASGIGDHLRNAFQSVESIASRVAAHIRVSWTQLATDLKDFGIGYAIAAGIEYAFHGMEKLVTEVEKLGPRAAAIGIPIAQLQDLNRWADDAGVSTDALDKVLTKMTATLGEVQAGGNKKATEALDDLGVNVKNADGSLRSTTEVLPEVIDALNAIHDPTRRAADAAAIFKLRWADVAPLMGATSEKIKQAREEQDKIGHISPEQQTRAEEYFAAHKRMMGALDHLQESIGARLLPAMTPLLNAITDIAGAFGKWADSAEGAQVASEASVATADAITTIAEVIKGVITAYEWLDTHVAPILNALVPSPEFAAKMRAFWSGLWDSIKATVSGWGTDIADVYHAALAKVADVGVPIFDAVAEKWHAAFDALTAAARAGWTDVVGVFDWAWGKISGVVGEITGVLDRITGAFHSMSSTADAAQTASATAADAAAQKAEDAAAAAERAQQAATQAAGALPAPAPGAPGAAGAPPPSGTVNVNITHANAPPGTRLNVATQGNGLKTTAQTGWSMPQIQTPWASPPLGVPWAPPA